MRAAAMLSPLLCDLVNQSISQLDRYENWYDK
jgi:hypothetical protein